MSRPRNMLPVIGQAPKPSPVGQEAVETASTERAERTVVRIEGMDCARCALTVKTVIRPLLI